MGIWIRFGRAGRRCGEQRCRCSREPAHHDQWRYTWLGARLHGTPGRGRQTRGERSPARASRECGSAATVHATSLSVCPSGDNMMALEKPHLARRCVVRLGCRRKGTSWREGTAIPGSIRWQTRAMAVWPPACETKRRRHWRPILNTPPPVSQGSGDAAQRNGPCLVKP